VAEPKFQPDVYGLADALTREYGLKALDVAVDTARQHMQSAAWKHCTMWLQVVNHLNVAAPRARLG
jgi:hypothetical protein